MKVGSLDRMRPVARAGILALLTGCGSGSSIAPIGILDDPVGVFGAAVALTGSESLAEAVASGAPGIGLDGGRIQYYVGFVQRSGQRDPIVLRYEDGALDWARSDYEVSPEDGSAYGLHWAGPGDFFVAFSARGNPVEALDDYRRFTTAGWLPEYGTGGGAEVSVLARIRELDGSPREATYLRAETGAGDAAALRITDVTVLESDLIQVDAESDPSPLDTDRSRLGCGGAGPFPYRLVLSNDLGTAVSAQGTGCS